MAFTPLTQRPNYGTVQATPPTPIPATLADATTYNTDLMPGGFGGVIFGLTSSQIVTITIQRYADLAGAIPVGPLSTQALTAATAGWTGFADGLPYLSFNCSIINASGSTANLTNGSILTGPSL